MRKLRAGLQSVYQPSSEKKVGRSVPIMSTYATSSPSKEHVNLDEPYRPKPLGERPHGPPKNSILANVDTTPTTPKLQHTTASRAVNTGRRPPSRKPRAVNPTAQAIVSEAKAQTEPITPLSPRTERAPSPTPISIPPVEQPPPSPRGGGGDSPRGDGGSPRADSTPPQPAGFVSASVPRGKRSTRVALSSYAAPLKDLMKKRDVPSRTTLSGKDTEKNEKDRQAAEEMKKTNVINLGQKQVMRVFLEDGTMKTLQVPLVCSAAELIEQMQQKLRLTDAVQYGVFEYHDKTEIKQLEPDVDLKAAVDTGTRENALFRLVFKKGGASSSSGFSSPAPTTPTNSTTSFPTSTTPSNSALESLIQQFPSPPDYIPNAEGSSTNGSTDQEPQDAAKEPSTPPKAAEVATPLSGPPEQPLPVPTAGSSSPGPVRRPAAPPPTNRPPLRQAGSTEDVKAGVTSPKPKPPVPARSISAKNVVNAAVSTGGNSGPSAQPPQNNNNSKGPALQGSISMKNVMGQPNPNAPRGGDQSQQPPQQQTSGGSGVGSPKPGPGTSPLSRFGQPGSGVLNRPVPPNAVNRPGGGAPGSPAGGGGGDHGSPRATSPFSKPAPPGATGRPPVRPARGAPGAASTPEGDQSKRGASTESSHQSANRNNHPIRPVRPPIGAGGASPGPASPGPASPGPSSNPAGAPPSGRVPPTRPNRVPQGASGPPQGTSGPLQRTSGPQPAKTGGSVVSAVSTPIYQAGDASREEILRIFFKDGTFRSLVVQGTTTTKNLFDSICNKFKDANLNDHALFHVRASQQRKLEDNEYVLALSDGFSGDADKIQFKHKDDVITLQKKVIRVYLTDNTYKSYQITSEDAVSDVIQMVAKKLALSPNGYSLFQMSTNQVTSRLDETENAWEVQENWEDGTIFVFANSPQPVMKKGFVADPEDMKPQERTVTHSFRPSYLMGQTTSSVNMAKLAKESIGNVQLRRVATPIERKHWDSMQVRALTQWFDWHAAKRDYFIQDLEHDICDGVLLINLLEILSGYDLGTYHDKPQMAISEKLENVSKSFDFMHEVGIPVRGCGPEDILDGNVKLILGMLWPLVFLGAVTPFDPRNTSEALARKELLAWCQGTVSGFQGVRIENFDSSWQDGLGFCALISKFAPNLLDYGSMVSMGKERIDKVMAIVEQLGIPPILLAQDLQTQFRPDERSVFAFLLVLKEKLTSL